MNKPAVIIEKLINAAKFSVQYIDSRDTKTIPCLLTPERAKRICEDNSITKVWFYIENVVIECEMI